MSDDIEDNDDLGMSPLPDLSTRHWRHPSELRQVNALPHPDPTPVPTLATDPTHPLRPLALVGGGLAVLAAGLMLVGPGDGLPSSIEATSFAGATSGGIDMAFETTQVRAMAELADLRGSEPVATSLAADDRANADSIDRPAADHPLPVYPAADRPSVVTSTTVPAPSTTRSGDDESGDGDTADRAMAAWQARPFGLVANNLPDAELLATVVPINGHLVTSAAAVDRLKALWLRGPYGTHQVTIAAVDEASELAILNVGLSTDTMASLMPPVALSPVALSTGVETVVAPLTGDGTPGTESQTGTVFALGKAAKTRQGTIIYDAISINLPARGQAAGSTVFDQEGRLLGLVIDGADANLTVLPIERVAAIANSLAIFGTGDPAWLGVETRPADRGPGLSVTSVAATSPARYDLHPGDVLVTVADVPLKTAHQLDHEARRAGPGNSLDVVIIRDGRQVKMSVLIGSVLDREQG